MIQHDTLLVKDMDIARLRMSFTVFFGMVFYWSSIEQLKVANRTRRISGASFSLVERLSKTRWMDVSDVAYLEAYSSSL
jgi:hypothetical protein